MPNFWRFNQTLFNGWRQWTTAWLDDIIFNNFWLQNNHIITETIQAWNMPTMNLLQVSNPKSDWGVLLDKFYKQRTITLKWHILWDSFQDEQNRIDSLKTALNVKQWYLDFKMPNWVYRRILCTLTNADIIDRQHYDIEHAKFSLTFRAEKPFRQEKVWSSWLFENVSSSLSEDLYNAWSEYSEPIININVNSASNSNSLSISIWDDTLQINHSLTANDLLSINVEEKTVLLNNVSIDFSWRFPRLSSWVNTLEVECNWTYDFDISILYPKNFL